MSGDMIDKEKKIKETEKLYMNLREILSKLPGPQMMVSLNKTQKALRERGRKMKVGEQISSFHSNKSLSPVIFLKYD